MIANNPSLSFQKLKVTSGMRNQLHSIPANVYISSTAPQFAFGTFLQCSKLSFCIFFFCKSKNQHISFRYCLSVLFLPAIKTFGKRKHQKLRWWCFRFLGFIVGYQVKANLFFVKLEIIYPDINNTNLKSLQGAEYRALLQSLAR